MSRATAPPPFLLVRARSTSRVLLTCEHATNRLPWTARSSPELRAALASHWGWDIGAWALTREIARRLRAGAIGGRWSRLVIDLNRRVGDPTLIRARAGDVLLPWNRKLGSQEIERRVMGYHAPYHLEVDRLILRRIVRGVRPLLLAIHSFTPVLDGRARPFEVGVLYDRHRGLARRLGAGLREAGLSMRYNEPYSGLAGMMYAVDRHGSHHGLPCLELELNQELLARRGAVRRLGAIVARGVAELIDEA
jgi:predicted N-formylglutamate amidohydrolase